MFTLRESDERHKHLAKPKIAVLMGGTSPEREVSFASGKAVVEALAHTGFQVEPIDVTADAVPGEAKDCEVIFSLLHGGFGENGGMQRRLEEAGVEYVGSGPEASLLMMDKARSKARLVAAGLSVPKGCLVGSAAAPMPADLPLPLIVKPNAGGSTVGLSVVRTQAEWPAALAKALKEDSAALVEEFVHGPELTVGLLDGHALTPVEIVPVGELYDYDAKYTYAHGKTEYFCPPRSLPPGRLPELQKLGEEAYRVLGARDLLRLDLRLEEASGRFKIFEGNSLPGFTSTSLLPKAANQMGISFAQLCTHLVLTALARKNT